MSYFNNNPYNPNPNPNPNNPYSAQNPQNLYTTPNNNYSNTGNYNPNQQQQYNYPNINVQTQQQQYGGYGQQVGVEDIWGTVNQYGGYWNSQQPQPQPQPQQQQQGYGKWQKWQQQPANNPTWQSQPVKQQSQFDSWKQKPQQQPTQQPTQQQQQQQQQAYSSMTSSITTPLNRTQAPTRLIKQQSINTQNINLYPDLPEQPEIKFEMGWVEEQNKNVSKQGQTSYISQIGNTATPKQPTGSLWDQVSQNFNLGFGAQNFINMQTQNVNYGGNKGVNQVNQQKFQGGNNQNQNFSSQNVFFALNPIFEQKVTSKEFPSPYIKYKIIPYLDEKKALDVCSATDNKKNLKKNNLTIWDYHGGPNQLYYIKKQSDGYCYIISVARGFALQVPNTTNQNSPMIANPMYGSIQEKWKLEPASHGCYGIVNKATSKALDLYHQKSDNGTPVIQWKYSQAPNQKWRIVPA